MTHFVAILLVKLLIKVIEIIYSKHIVDALTMNSDEGRGQLR